MVELSRKKIEAPQIAKDAPKKYTSWADVVPKFIDQDELPKGKKVKVNHHYLLDEFAQIKTYLRKGQRPSQKLAIEMFEQHLREVVE